MSYHECQVHYGNYVKLLVQCDTVLRCAAAGEYDRAQPLYERALAIWERTHGPEHPDVAHTLTDLAVLHLEQVSRACLHSPLQQSVHA